MSDASFVKVLVDQGMPEDMAVKFLSQFISQKTGEEWCYITWDPTPEEPMPRSEFVRSDSL